MWSECQVFLWLTLTEADEQRYAVPKSVLQPRQILLFTEFYFYWDAGRKKTFDNNQTVDWDDSSCWGLRVCYRLCVKCRGLHLEVTHEILNAKKLTSEATARQWRHHAAASRKSVGAVSCNWSSVAPTGRPSSSPATELNSRSRLRCRRVERRGQSLWRPTAERWHCAGREDIGAIYCAFIGWAAVQRERPCQ